MSCLEEFRCLQVGEFEVSIGGTDEDLDLIFTWREQRKVSLALTLNYAREIYMLADTAGNRRLIQQYVDVYEYPDGRIEVRAGGRALPYVRYDRLAQIDIAAVVENKRLGHALRAAQAIQARRDDRRSTPSRTNQCQPARPRKAAPGKIHSRQFEVQDFEQALREACKSKTPLPTASITPARPSNAIARSIHQR